MTGRCWGFIGGRSLIAKISSRYAKLAAVTLSLAVSWPCSAEERRSTVRPCSGCPEFAAVPSPPKGMRRIKFVATQELTWRDYLRSYDKRQCVIPSAHASFTRVSKGEIEHDIDAFRLDWPITVLGPVEVHCFVTWLQRQTKLRVALPSAQEWEWFARADLAGAKFPWGNNEVASNEALDLERSPIPNLYPYAASDSRSRLNRVFSGAKTKQFPPNRWGLYDLMGNNFELTSEVFDEALWRSRKKLPALPPKQMGLRRVLLKGSNFLSSDWNQGISQEHFTFLESNSYGARVALRLILIEEGR